MKNFISIYKSVKKEGMYIYIDKAKGISEVPESLLELFGTPKLVTHMIVDENKTFAKVDAKELLESIEAKGFYLQMPDPNEDYRDFVVKQNSKL